MLKVNSVQEVYSDEQTQNVILVYADDMTMCFDIFWIIQTIIYVLGRFCGKWARIVDITKKKCCF